MAIPIYGARAEGGTIISLDDQSVVADLAALAGTGGNAYTCRMLSAPFQAAGYATLRRLIQSVPHDGAVSVAVTPYRDGQETGQTITRALATGDNPTITAPIAATGTNFQVEIALSSFDAPAEVGAGEVTLIPRRSQR